MTSISPSHVNITLAETSNIPPSTYPNPNHVKEPPHKYHYLITSSSKSSLDPKMHQPIEAIVLQWDAEKKRYVKKESTTQSSAVTPAPHPRNPSPTFYRSSHSAFLPFKKGC